MIVAIIWGYGLAWFGAMGIQYVARVSLFINIIPLIMILVVFAKVNLGFSHYVPPEGHSFAGFVLMLQIVTGFFATCRSGRWFGFRGMETQYGRA